MKEKFSKSFFIFRIPDANPEELVDQDCVICWAPMETAKKLPCGHLFHGTPCLRNWLEEATYCPLCKAPIDANEYEKYLSERSQTNTPIIRQQQQQQQQQGTEIIQNEQLQERINEIYQNVFQQYGITMNEDTISINQQEEDQFENKYENKEEAEIKIDKSSSNENQVDSQEEKFKENIQTIQLDSQIMNLNSNSRVDKIMADMYIKHLENYKKLMDETIKKLETIRDE